MWLQQSNKETITLWFYTETSHTHLYTVEKCMPDSPKEYYIMFCHLIERVSTKPLLAYVQRQKLLLWNLSVSHHWIYKILPGDLKPVIIRFQDRLSYHNQVSNLEIKVKERECKNNSKWKLNRDIGNWLLCLLDI